MWGAGLTAAGVPFVQAGGGEKTDWGVCVTASPLSVVSRSDCGGTASVITLKQAPT